MADEQGWKPVTLVNGFEGATVEVAGSLVRVTFDTGKVTIPAGTVYQKGTQGKPDRAYAADVFVNTPGGRFGSVLIPVPGDVQAVAVNLRVTAAGADEMRRARRESEAAEAFAAKAEAEAKARAAEAENAALRAELDRMRRAVGHPVTAQQAAATGPAADGPEADAQVPGAVATARRDKRAKTVTQ